MKKDVVVILIPLILAAVSYYVQGVAEGAYDNFALGTSYYQNTSEYKEIASQQDDFLSEIMTYYDIRETVFFVTSDHGHINRGGHGGYEEETVTVPLVVYGAVITPVTGEAENTDIAPTVAALLGMRIPTHSQGRILFNGIDISEEKKASWLLQLAQQRKTFTQFYLGVIGAEKEINSKNLEDALAYFDAGSYRESIQSSEEFIEAVARITEEAQTEKISGERLRRIPLFLSIVIIPLVIGFLALKKGWLTKKHLYIALMCGVLYIILFNVIFFALGNTYSLSTINDDPDIGPFFDMITLLGVSLPLLIMVFVGGYLRKEGKIEIVKYCWVSSAVISYFLLVQLGVHYLLQNNGISWYIPNMMLGFKYYVDAMQFIPLGYTSFLHPLVALIVVVIAGRLLK